MQDVRPVCCSSELGRDGPLKGLRLPFQWCVGVSMVDHFRKVALHEPQNSAEPLILGSVNEFVSYGAALAPHALMDVDAVAERQTYETWRQEAGGHGRGAQLVLRRHGNLWHPKQTHAVRLPNTRPHCICSLDRTEGNTRRKDVRLLRCCPRNRIGD